MDTEDPLEDIRTWYLVPAGSARLRKKKITTGDYGKR